MPNRSEAEEHLRVIRSLMEKATIYRAISAEAALVGGLLAIAGSFVQGNWISGLLNWHRQAPSLFPSTPIFASTWVVILVGAATANLWVIRQAALRRSETFISSGMKLALFSLFPAFLVAGMITLELLLASSAYLAVPVWVVCYGMGLLATRHFAPRSLIYLGWSFVLCGLALLPLHWSLHWLYDPNSPANIETVTHADWSAFFVAQMTMALTFGAFHLIYAACTWPRKSTASETAGEG